MAESYGGKTKRKWLDQQRQAMLSDRSDFEFIWQEIAKYILPMRPRGCIGDGQIRLSRWINNSKATRSQRRLRAVVQSELMSPSSDWYELTTGIKELDEDKPTAQWLRDERDGQLADMDQSNTYTEADLAIGDSANFGTGAMLMDESLTTAIRCTALPIGTYSIGVDDEGKVDRICRDYMMSVSQLVQRFCPVVGGKRDVAKLPQSVRDAYDARDVLKKFPVSHMIYPNEAWDPQAPGDEFQYEDCYWITNSTESDPEAGIMREGGYREFPVMVPRWEVAAGDIYGTNCPGITALQDVMELQTLEADYGRLVALIRKPPTVGPAGVKSGTANGISMLPGAYNEEPQGGASARPLLQVNPQALGALESKIVRIEAAIDESYHADIAAPNLDNTRQQPDTAAAVYAKSDERASMLGPVVTRWDDDFSDPLITRLYGIRQRQGRVKPFTPKMMEYLQNGELKVGIRLVSKMAVAQKTVGLAALERDATWLLEAAKVVPQLLDNKNWDRVAAQRARMLGSPPDTNNSPEEMVAIRQMRAQAQAQAVKAQQDALAAQTAANAAKVDMNKDTAGSRLVAAGGT